MSWHLRGHRIATLIPQQGRVVATCGEVIVTGPHYELSPDEPSTETRCPHCTWDTTPGTTGLHPAAIRHHLNAARTAHREARRP